MATRGRPSSREKILDALEVLLIDVGVGGVTLDAVAEAAEVSKGGLLYHFASKAALFDALTARLEAEIDTATAAAPEDPAALVRWYVENGVPATPDEGGLYRSLMAGLRTDDPGDDGGDQVGVPMAALFDRYAAPLAGLEDPVLAETVKLIGDGLWIGALVGLPPPAPAVLEAVIERLVAELG